MSQGEAVREHDLVEYGIQNEGSHVRVHVCPTVRRVYVFPTECGKMAIETLKYQKKHGFQPGYEGPTAEGYPVPPEDIERCVEICLRDTSWDSISFSLDDSTEEKGNKAVKLVKAMLRNGLLPLPAEGREVKDKDMQIQGTDILIKANSLYHEEIRVQVKCDYPGGRKELGGTGNLFLQVAECNPFGLH